jgi:hypothetical protein
MNWHNFLKYGELKSQYRELKLTCLLLRLENSMFVLENSSLVVTYCMSMFINDFLLCFGENKARFGELIFDIISGLQIIFWRILADFWRSVLVIFIAQIIDDFLKQIISYQ